VEPGHVLLVERTIPTAIDAEPTPVVNE
jgi:hypothetical protein